MVGSAAHGGGLAAAIVRRSSSGNRAPLPCLFSGSGWLPVAPNLQHACAPRRRAAGRGRTAFRRPPDDGAARRRTPARPRTREAQGEAEIARDARRPGRVPRRRPAPGPAPADTHEARPSARRAVGRLRRRHRSVGRARRAARHRVGAPTEGTAVRRRPGPHPPRRCAREDVVGCAARSVRTGAGARGRLRRRRRLAAVPEADRDPRRHRAVAEGARAPRRPARQARSGSHPRHRSPSPTALPGHADPRPLRPRATEVRSCGQPALAPPTRPPSPGHRGGAATRAARSSPTRGCGSRRARPAHRAAR